MKLLLLVLFLGDAFAGFSELNSNDLYQYKEEKKPVITKKRKVVKKRHKKDKRLENLTKTLLEQDKKLSELLERNEKRVIVRKKAEKIRALTRVEGVVLNSILAMNIKSSTFIVKILEGDTLEGGELRCKGISFQKRVPAKCNLLVLEDSEHIVDIEIWDLDGAEGIIADYFYSGEEKAFITSSFASFMQGILDVAQDRITTPFGEVNKNNAKNRVLSGLMGVGRNAREKVVESGERKLTISYVNSGKRVLIFFNKSLNLEEGA